VGAVWDESARAGFTELLPEGHEFPEFKPELWPALLEQEGVRILVAEEPGEPGLLGYTAYGANRDPDAGPDVGEVRTFFVHSRAWRRGVGTAMIQRALSDLRETGYAEATVWSFSDNARANAFYEHHGFERDGAERREEAWAEILEVRYRRAVPQAVTA
jgi:GNAT superfamily N-acetyltransferase